ncbi:hypothetical protein Tco_1575697 [Tanacetum coccineum]
MCTYLKNMGGFTHNQLKNKSFEEIQKAFDKTMSWINLFVPMDSEVVKESEDKTEGGEKKAEGSRKKIVGRKREGEKHDEESVKKQKLKDDAEKAELKLCLEIVLKDDEVISVESLDTKYPIVDWKTHIILEDEMYYQIIKADGSTKLYKIFTAILDDFDRQVVLDLYRLVKERFETASITTLISSYTHPSIPSDYDVDDVFSSTNAPNYIPTPPSYSLVTPGNISPDSSDDLTKDLLSSLSISPFHDDPYMKVVQAYDAIPPPQVIIALPAIVPSPMFDSQDFFPPEEISLPKDTETPVESPIPVSPSSSIGSSSLIRSTTSPPDYPLISYLSGRGMKPLGSKPIPEEPNESNAC